VSAVAEDNMTVRYGEFTKRGAPMSRNPKSFKVLYFWMLVAFLGLGLMAGQASAAVICGVTNTSVITGTGSMIVIRATFATPVTQRIDIKDLLKNHFLLC
jgi:hypothetical protein